MGDLVADYVVVGGGLTGCPLASRLSQSDDKPEVILVEAGPDPSGDPATATFLSGLSLLGGKFDYAYPSEPVASTAGRVHFLNAGKTLGGGSVLNFGAWLRADAADYNHWAEVVGDERWSYEGIKPWLIKSESFKDPQADASEHGFNGPMHVTLVSQDESGARKYPLRETIKQAWADVGVYPHPEAKNGCTTGLTEIHENSSDGLRQPSHLAYSLRNVEVMCNTLVHKVTFTDLKLLMLSGIGPSATLAKHKIPLIYDAPQVGQNLHDHFAIYLAFRLRDPSAGYALGSAGFQNPAFSKGFPWDWVASQPLPEELITKHGANPNLKKCNFYEIVAAYVPHGIPGIPVDGSHIATSTMLLLPTSRGTVSIRSHSPNDLPCIQPSYLSTELDRDAIIHATRQTLKVLLATKPMESVVESESPPSGEGLGDLAPLIEQSSDEAIQDRISLTGTQHHHSGGTAAMGEVVDVEGRVLGVQGLRVVDASIIPVPLGGHPQATLYVMAEQLASIITRDS
ncbi:hypothetical protein E8E14_001832 [Neopestalotiopsis sp. 37M]|nr:hypothetical protein E8E14_001832 [Neopestalotiopsis sp. 37M]